MADVVQNIIVDFQVDYSQLDKAGDTLEKLGVIDAKAAQSFKNTNQQIAQQGSELGELKQLLGQFAQAAQKMGGSVKSAFEQGVTDALDKAGVTLEEFLTALKNSPGKIKSATQSLRQELKQLTADIAAAKATGGPVDPSMIKRAGQLKDAIADANQEISNAGSDTRGVDNVIGSVQAMAGAFAVAQGAEALFGEENEDLQKALLKVNAAMALSQGVQQVLNAVQKEGALTKLADATATGLQTAAQKIYTAVTGNATAATVGFKVALAATGIGAAIVLVLALASAFSDEADEAENASNELERQKGILEGLNEIIERRTGRQEADAKRAGKAESELIRIRGRGINDQIDAIDKANDALRRERDAVDSTSQAYFDLNKQIEENNNTRAGLQNQAVIAAINLEKQLADEQKDAAEKAKERAEKAAEEGRKRRDAELQNRIDTIKKELIEVEKGGALEVNVRQRLVIAEAALEIAQTEGNKTKIALIQAQSADERFKIQLEFLGKAAAADKEAREHIIAVLDQHIQEVNDKLNAQLIYEQSLLDARTGKTRRALQTIANDQEKSVDDRINALSSLERFELTSIDKQIANVSKLLISEEEKVLKIAELEDKREQVIEGTETAITAITKSEEDKRKKIRQEAFQNAVAVVEGIAELFGSFNQLLSEQENARLGEQRAQLQALVDAGAITEKEAARREKQLEAQEKQIKQRQAQREKQLALFNAVINGAQAVVSALARGGPVLAAITGALVAAQIAIIASRPIPKFFKGKKDKYSGLGVVGESGAELIERDGRMFIAPKKTITYLGPTDTVFTPTETKRIMQNTTQPKPFTSTAERFDYDRLVKAMGKSKDVNISIEKDFIAESVGTALNKYFDMKRYKF